MVLTASSERITLKDMTYPVIHLDKSRRRDKSVSFSISLFLHTLIFAMVGFSFIKPSEFGVDKGQSGIEVSLVSALTEEPVAELVQELPTPQEASVPTPPSAPKLPEPIKEQTPVVDQQKTLGQDKVNFKSTGGAISEAKPDYFQNPAPEYPLEARQKGWEGIVILKVFVSKKGEPISVEIEQGSGHVLLDRTALKAVKKWKFRPALFGDISVESSVRVPVRFDLQRLKS